jgi:hypothetical protein
MVIAVLASYLPMTVGDSRLFVDDALQSEWRRSARPT